MFRTLFGARAQVVVGAFAFVLSVGFWTLGTAIIPVAATLPWRWTPAAFIFHASMFALVVASYAIVATGLGYRATERVEAVVADVEHAETVDVETGMMRP